jgi:dihydropyrimidinase
VVEREATYRAIALAELVDTPIQVFHVSCAEVAEEIARAKLRGLKVWGETCPQYFALTAADMARENFEGAKYMCSPAPRDESDHEGLWEMMRRGILDVVSSDHSAFNFTGTWAKDMNGRDAPFRDIPNGVPGVGTRMPLLYSEGVVKGRIDLPTFVGLSSTNAARIFGLEGRKGAIIPGADADIVVWDPTLTRTITNAELHHAVDYTPYEGREVTGWPVVTVRRGEVVMREGDILGEEGSGIFLARGPYDIAKPTGHLANGFDASTATIVRN